MNSISAMTGKGGFSLEKNRLPERVRVRPASVQALAEPARGHGATPGRWVVAEERGMQTLRGVHEPTVLFLLVRASGRRSGQVNLDAPYWPIYRTLLLCRERRPAGT